ncbi:MAG TPA: hypothetical protein VGE38_01095 [Nocardioides sp.]|uniref:hypothetical protein n=1 Tax=Nocardioides sp. TaxID=35761 RepID=UPI002EDA3FAA
MAPILELETQDTQERRWAWILPVVTLVVGSFVSTDADGVAVRVLLGAWFLISLSVGVAWQLLYRRNLADRFGLLAALFVLAMIVGLCFGSVSVGTAGGVRFDQLALPSILAGVVLTEWWLRDRERSRR